MPAWREVLGVFVCLESGPPLSHLALKAQLKFHLLLETVSQAPHPPPLPALGKLSYFGLLRLSLSASLICPCHILMLSQYTGKSRKKCVLHIFLPSYSQYIDSNGRLSISRWWCCLLSLRMSQFPGMNLKDFYPLKESYDKPRLHIKKQRHHFADKRPYSQSCGFPSSHVWIWESDHKKRGLNVEELMLSNCGVEKTLENPLDCKEIKPVNPKGNQP